MNRPRSAWYGVVREGRLLQAYAEGVEGTCQFIGRVFCTLL